MLLLQCGICYIIPEQGETMRIYFYFFIALLFNILAVGMSSAQTLDHACHEETKAREAVSMVKCNCPEATPSWNYNFGSDRLVGEDCCASETCRLLSIPQDVVPVSCGSSIVFSGMVQEPSFFQPMPLAFSGSCRTTLPPLLLPSTPAYIENCVFLI